jgi:two-component system, LytTR family, sensor kinase
MDTSDKIKTGGAKKWISVAMHVLIWGMVFAIPYIFSSNAERGNHHPALEEKFLYLTSGLDLFWVALFYLNALVLIPRFIYKHRVVLYILSLVGALCVVVALDGTLFNVLHIPYPFSIKNSVAHNIIPFLFALAVSSAYRAIADKTKTDILLKERESENLKTELSFLRSQVSPHFLFNVLNNIASLARKKSDDLEPTVMKLSSLMRYMLYENDEDKVLIKHEVEYLRDYIDLQKQRFGNELLCNVSFDTREEWHTIEPMLLIPFVENAFKHGGGMIQHPEIDIQLQADHGELHFTVKNKFEDLDTPKDKASGIGLVNVKRRLELLYPGKHTLKIDKKGKWFVVDLNLNL